MTFNSQSASTLLFLLEVCCISRLSIRFLDYPKEVLNHRDDKDNSSRPENIADNYDELSVNETFYSKYLADLAFYFLRRPV